MKLKLRYFIRGLGIGIVFTAIIMSLSLQASRSRIIRENALTKEEIMEKAMGYGMILDSSEDTTPVEENDSSKEEQDQEENDDKDVIKSEEVAETKDDSSEDKEETSVDSIKDEETSTQETNEKSKDTKEEVADENSKKDDSVVSIDYIPIKITSGMTATAVGHLLKEEGVIDDPDEFRSYMSEQGYSSKILTGNYLIPVSASYKKIAKIITTKQ